MVQRRQRERSLFEVLLPDGHKLWPDWLRKIDTLLEDDAVIEVVAQALEKRWPQSRRRGHAAFRRLRVAGRVRRWRGRRSARGKARRMERALRRRRVPCLDYFLVKK